MGAVFSDLGQDVRYSARALVRTPGFTLAAAVCLGIGIGLTTSIFTQFRATIFKATPGVDRPDSLVSFQSPVSFPDFENYRDHSGQFESATAFLAPVPFVVSAAGGPPERLWGHLVTPDYFQVLGGRPALGRWISPEDAAAPGSAPVVVLSDATWRARYAADPAIVGKAITLGRQRFDVVAVAAFDRFARSVKHLVNALEEFRVLRIDFVSLREAIDTSTPMGKAMFVIVGAMAELESSLIAERTAAAMQYAQTHGTRSGRAIGRPRVVFDREEAYRMRNEQRMSYRQIAKALGVSPAKIHAALKEYKPGRSKTGPLAPADSALVDKADEEVRK